MTIALPESRPAPTLAVRPTISDKLAYCRELAASGMLPSQYRKNPANLLYAVEYADSLGLHPMVAITGVHVIEGKPSASSALISALVRRAGHKLRVSGDAQTAVAQIIRHDDPDHVFEVRFTVEDAQRAGLLNKPIWNKYRPAMLKARAITAVARDACEEALFGVHYTPEELGAVVDQEGNPVYLSGEIQRDGADEQPQQPLAPAGPSRDYLAEARADEATADQILALYRDAEAEGAPPEYLEQLVDLGRAKRAAEQVSDAAGESGWRPDPTPTAGSGTTADAATAPATASPAPDQPDAAQSALAARQATARAAAIDDMYRAARDAGLTPAEADQAMQAAHGALPVGATAEQIAAQTADLRAATQGGAQ